MGVFLPHYCERKRATKTLRKHDCLAFTRRLVLAAQLRARKITSPVLRRLWTTQDDGDGSPKLMEIPAVKPAPYQPLADEPLVPPADWRTLPRKLARPDLPDIKPEIVVSAQPGYEGISPSHVRSSWSHMGYKALGMYRKVFLDPPKSALPAAYNILLRDGGIAMCCTHLFAVYAYAAPGTFGPAARRRKCPRYRRVVGLYPTHAAIWAAYCARLPALPLRPTRLRIFEDPRAGAGAERATVLHMPVVPLAVPCPRMFLPVVMFVYSFRQSTFVNVLLPCAVFELPADSVATPLEGYVPRYAQALVDEGDMARLCRMAKNVHDVWRNMVALGVVEDRMWEALDIAWEIVLTAMELVDRKAQAA